ncbi:MAG: glycosyltransferase involved in cell wall biosynthesis [Myxococcota bacterium]|jgi:glycosyltransferase involved in cell wall biosynthesis
MKLLVLTTSYPKDSNDPGGAFVAEMCDALGDAGLGVRVVAMATDRRGALQALQDGRWLRVARDTARFVRRARGNEDAVLAHWLVPSALIGLRLGVPVVGVAHGSDVQVLRRLPLLRSFLADRMAGLIAVSKEAAQAIRCSPTFVRPMGLLRRDFVVARPSVGLPLKVLFIGRDVPIKGLEVAVAATRGLRNVHLTVAGCAGNASHVTWIGHLPPVQRAAVIAAHDLVVVPSVGPEGVPRVIAEAYAAGVPVLASRIGGIVDWVPGSDLVEAGDVTRWRTELAVRAERLRMGRPVGELTDVAALEWGALGPQLAAFLGACTSRWHSDSPRKR